MKNTIRSLSRGTLLRCGLFAVLVLMILAANIRNARAYFTTYTDARGGYTIHLGDHTTQEEHYAGGEKIINITNSEDSQPVWVRVRAYTGTEYQNRLSYTEKTGDGANVEIGSAQSGWDKSGDWYYYRKPLGAGDSTGAFSSEDGSKSYQGLVVGVSDLLRSDVEAGTNVNVVIVYETIPVSYDSEGNVAAWTEEDWKGLVNATTKTI